MTIYRIFCDNCGLDTYITADRRPFKCPSCDNEELFMAASEPECEEAELDYHSYIGDTADNSLESASP